ncbi:DUF1173 family protein [Hydrogenovibrio marinus]|uniref:Uncharacterized protein n=1 Tax=Hydrogenovibrio marinus TaxID=28885 RepID=A0A066ZXB4_HYDMR|nr:DUF1173 family protein [Hydrogenovibrio marinus]KDN94710.1 hypothetical protein EI16_12500 [Hydrogenovibrio marinus]
MKYVISLCNGKEIFQDEIVEEDSQLALRNAYVNHECKRAKCNCNPDESLELVIAYRRITDKFELRKKPNQDYKLHAQDCRFHEPPKAASPGESADLTIALPDSDSRKIPDHTRASDLLHALWSRLEKQLPSTDGKKYGLPWYEIRDNLIEISESTLINQSVHLHEIFQVIKPEMADNLTPIEIPQDKSTVLLGELFQANEFTDRFQNQNIAITLKGTNTTIYLNQSFMHHLSDKTKRNILGECPPGELRDKDARRIILMVVMPSSTGKSIQCFSLATLLVDKDSFLTRV